MAIISWPDDLPPMQFAICIVCNVKKPAAEITIGPCDAKGRQAFSCNDHFRSGSQFIVGWADFAAEQSEILNQVDGTLVRGDNNERTLY